MVYDKKNKYNFKKTDKKITSSWLNIYTNTDMLQIYLYLYFIYTHEGLQRSICTLHPDKKHTSFFAGLVMEICDSVMLFICIRCEEECEKHDRYRWLYTFQNDESCLFCKRIFFFLSFFILFYFLFLLQ